MENQAFRGLVPDFYDLEIYSHYLDWLDVDLESLHSWELAASRKYNSSDLLVSDRLRELFSGSEQRTNSDPQAYHERYVYRSLARSAVSTLPVSQPRRSPLPPQQQQQQQQEEQHQQRAPPHQQHYAYYPYDMSRAYSADGYMRVPSPQHGERYEHHGHQYATHALPGAFTPQHAVHDPYPLPGTILRPFSASNLPTPPSASPFTFPSHTSPKPAAIPGQRPEGWAATRQHFSQALREMLPSTLLTAHAFLKVGEQVLQFAPFPGLALAASLLLSIWDNVQGVDNNRLGCLSLAERCVKLFLSVQKEVHEGGDKVVEEMAKPIQGLVETFTRVRDFLLKQASQSFLSRYLKRQNILREIADCNTSLDDALTMFALSVQMRILKQVKETEDRREAENRALLKAIVRVQQQGQRQLTPSDS